MLFGPIKLQYVLLYAIVGAWMPYLPVYLDELGLGDWQIGWIIGVYGLAVLIMPAVIAAVADRWMSNRTLMGISYFLSTVLLVGITVVNTFVPLLVLSLFFSMAYTPVFALTDGMAFAAMHDVEEAGGRPPAYHRLRIWGSIGFIIPSLIIFVILATTEASSRMAMVTAAVMAGVAFLATPLLPLTRRAAGEAAKKLPTGEAWRALVSRPAIHLVGPLFLMFTAISIFYVFYTIYLRDLGIDEAWLGIIVNIGVVAEVAMMLFSGRVLQWLGLKGLMTLGAVSMTLRLALIAAVPTVPVAIVTQLLHAPIVLAIYVAPPMYLNLKAQRSYRNSMQGVYIALCFGIARMIGSVAGGYAADGNGQAGTLNAFWLGAMLSGAAVVWLVVLFRDAPASAAMKRQTEDRSQRSEDRDQKSGGGDPAIVSDF